VIFMGSTFKRRSTAEKTAAAVNLWARTSKGEAKERAILLK